MKKSIFQLIKIKSRLDDESSISCSCMFDYTFIQDVRKQSPLINISPHTELHLESVHKLCSTYESYVTSYHFEVAICITMSDSRSHAEYSGITQEQNLAE